MLGAQLIPSSFNNPAGSANGGFPGAKGFLNGFPNNGNGLGNKLGQLKQALGGNDKEAGQVTLSRLVSSVESRFTATSVQTTASASPVSPEQDFSPEAVTDRILGFVKQRLDKEKANGASEERLQELLDQAREGIEKGFAEARNIISDQGLFTDDVKDNFFATVSRVQEGLDELEDSIEKSSDEPSQLSQAVASGSDSSRAIQGARFASEDIYYNQTRSFDMQVKTRDGDLVTIRVNGEESFASSSFAAAGDGVSVAGFEAGYSSSSRFSFSVEGDLDEGELAALNDLFSQVNDIADDFYAGDVEAAFNQAMEVGYDASELAGFAVNMRRTEVVAVRQAYAEVSRYGAQENGGGVPANPLQSVMDTLSDFASRLEQSRAALLEGAGPVDGNGSLFADLIKNLIPADESAKNGSQDQSGEAIDNLNPYKEAFDRFVDTLVA